MASFPIAVLEPLHPIFAADRAVLSTLGQCLDVAAPFDARDVGVVVDTYHVWWDPQLREQIARAAPRLTHAWGPTKPSTLPRGSVGTGPLRAGFSRSMRLCAKMPSP